MSVTPWVLITAQPVQHTRSNGQRPLLLEMFENGSKVGGLTVISGSPAYQHFRRASDPQALPGSLEPIPEGRYLVHPTEWAGGRGNWNASWAPAIGPWWCRIDPLQSMVRGDFGHHMDANRDIAPGTAGCIGYEFLLAAQRWLDWRAKWPEPILQIVDWGTGSVKRPDWSKPDAPLRMVKLFVNEGRTSTLVAGRPVPGLDLRLTNAAGSLSYSRDGAAREVAWARVEVGETVTV